MVMKLKWMRVLALALVLGSLAAILVGNPPKAQALSGADFDPGYIISDSQFYAKDAMSQDQIQSFLDANIGTCRNSFCLNVLKVDTPTTTLSFGTCETYRGEANESAARIIYKVQQACSISAKVLLVTLQKEQGLVTSRAPTEGTLRKALGQGCPDTAPCDSAFYGFFNQMYSGARQLTWYGNPQGSHTSIKVGQQNAVRFHPNAGCGSANVVIQNRATAALYYYTPYQPNAAALANLSGVGDACSSYGNRNFWRYYNSWFGSPTSGSSPIGNVESVRGGIGGVTVSGWAIDPDSTAPIDVHVYVDGVGSRTSANLSRPDVGAAYPAFGAAHGFSATVPVSSSGTHSVCVYGINVLGGTNTLYGCSNVVAQGGSPVGVLESVKASEGKINVGGWAIDPDSTASIPVHVYIDSASVALTASLSRPDVGNANPGYGNLHGFSGTFTASPGEHRVCVFGINTGAGANSQIGCSTVVVPAAPVAPTPTPDQGRVPFGQIDGIKAVQGGIEARGWAIDPDTASPVAVHIYVGTAGAAYQANKSRPDVGAAYAGFGNNHGYSESIAASPGAHKVCVYAINTGPGPHALVGCGTVTVPAEPVAADQGRVPFGQIDGINAVQGGIEARGWAIDPDTASPVAVHIYVGSAGAEYQANKSRPDVGAAYTGFGNNHGYSESIAASPGTHNVCVYAINTGPGPHAPLGCGTVTVPAVPVAADQGRAPFGAIDRIQGTGGAVQVSGWAIDPDSAAPIQIHVYVDGVGVAYEANKSRVDVSAAFPGFGTNHGYSESITTPSGMHEVCIYAINSGPGSHTLLGCTRASVT